MTVIVDQAWADYRALVPINEEPDPTDKKAQAMREELILTHLPLTVKVAAKMSKTMPNHVDKDDLESYAKIGLIRAITRYNHLIGVPFEAYAMTNMRSVILDGIRSLDWAPRSLRRKERELFTAHQTLRQDLGREPTKQDLATKLDIPLDEIADRQNRSFAASTTYLEENTETIAKRSTNLTTEEESLAIRFREAVAQEIAQLPFREAVVIGLHYYQGKKLAEVAAALGVSEVKAGMIHTEAVLHIWNGLESLRNH